MSLKRRRGRLASFLITASVLATTGVTVAPPAGSQSAVDQRLERTEERLQAARDRQRVLTEDVERYGQRIGALEDRLAPMRARAQALEGELASLRIRLEDLGRRLRAEGARLAIAQRALARRQELLSRRLRELYVRGEPDLILVLIESGSLASAIETVDLLEGIAERDANLAGSVSRYADELRRRRDEIARLRATVGRSESRVSAAAAEASAAKAVLEDQQSDLRRLLQGREQLLAGVAGSRRELEEEARGLRARSDELAQTIRAAQDPTAAPPSAPSGGSSGQFAWPVQGTLTSTYGPRWGRMHEGIDIAGSSGTPIAAAAAGTVIVAGWSGGYGNLVVVDHGGGVSTAYAHNSTIAVSVGQSVGQGTVLAGMGTTGNSTGVHCHFEIRINGAAVDPLQYL